MLQLLVELCARGSEFVNQSQHTQFPFGHNESEANSSGFDQIKSQPSYRENAYRETTFATLWITFQINIILCLLQLLLFWVGLKCAPHIFAPRLEPSDVPKWPLGWVCKVWKEMRVAPVPQERRDRRLRARKPSSSRIPPVPETGATLLAGRLNNLDGAVMVRFCVLGFKFSFVASMVASFLLPWYYDGGLEDLGNPNADFQKFNLANLKEPKNTHRFWPSVLCAYILFGVWIHFSVVEWGNFEKMRKEHFKRLACGKMDEDRPGAAQAARSVLVELVPTAYRDVTGVTVMQFFGRLFPHVPEGLDNTCGGVHSAVVQPETAELYGKVDAVFLSEGKRRLRDLRNAMAPLVRKAKEEKAEKLKLQKQMTNAVLPDASVVCSVAASSSFAASLPSRARLSNPDGGIHTPATSVTPGRLQQMASQRLSPRPEYDDAIQDSRSNTWAHEVAESGEIMAKATKLAAEGMLQGVQHAACLFQDIVLPSSGGVQTGSSTAFVTFYAVSDRVAAEQLVLVPRDGQGLESHRWLVSPAPEAADIIWANASVPHTQRWVRTWIVRFLLLIVMLFWIVPITFIQVWTRLDNWDLKWIQDLKKDPVGEVLYTLLASYMPVLAQMGLMYALPVLLETVGKRIEQEKIKSKIQVVVVGRYLRFLMVTIYITIIGGSLLQSMCQILKDPYDVFDILQHEVPQVATYFISYVMARAGLSAPMLLLFAIFSACERDDEQRILVRPNYAMEASNLVLVMVLGMTYCIIAPMISFACAVYFALTSFIYAWLFLYVYTPEYDCKGQMWSHMFNGCLVGFLLGAASLAGIASAYVGPTSGSFVATLVLCLLVAMLFPYFRMTYTLPGGHIPLEVAREVDMACSKHIDMYFNAGYYFDPVIQGPSRRFSSRSFSCWSCLCCCWQPRPPAPEDGYRQGNSEVDGSADSSAEPTEDSSEEDRSVDGSEVLCAIPDWGIPDRRTTPLSSDSDFSDDVQEEGDANDQSGGIPVRRGADRPKTM